MLLPAAPIPWLVRTSLWLALGTVAACAAQTPAPVAPAPARPRGLAALPAEAPPGQRVIVLLAQDAPDAEAAGERMGERWAERLSAVAQVPVRVVRALTPRRWALQLQCDGQAACAAALERLAAARSLVQAVESDPPVQIPARPKGAITH